MARSEARQTPTPELRPDLDTASVHTAERITMHAAKSRSSACEGDVSGVGKRVNGTGQSVRRDMDGIPAD